MREEARRCCACFLEEERGALARVFFDTGVVVGSVFFDAGAFLPFFFLEDEAPEELELIAEQLFARDGYEDHAREMSKPFNDLLAESLPQRISSLPEGVSKANGDIYCNGNPIAKVAVIGE